MSCSINNVNKSLCVLPEYFENRLADVSVFKWILCTITKYCAKNSKFWNTRIHEKGRSYLQSVTLLELVAAAGGVAAFT